MRVPTIYKQMLMAFILLLCSLSITQGQTANEVAKKIMPSVVVLFNENSKGKSISLGSGFFVRSDVIATNYHVVKGAGRLYAKLINQPRLYQIKKILAYDSGKDIALLKISGVEASPLWIGNSCIMEAGDTVYVVGNPKGLEGTFS
jgi:S1-C subfamily serine protease